ncbi:MAG: DUF2169 domain-containing protein [Deltaproteobacteria bacterium]|nr:DUF2169 domain-containing protein [Deltaproteobacteria bacterium]
MSDPDPWPIRVSARGPVAAGARLWRLAGQLNATVFVKATFQLVAGSVMTPLDPEPIRTADGPDGSGRWAVRETAPALPRAEVVLVGHARPSAPAARARVRLAVLRDDVALLDKTLEVWGDRARPEAEPARFDKIPLGYARTWGGAQSEMNPAGTGLGASAGCPPNVLDPARPGEPVGFAPLPASFPARQRLLGGHPRGKIEQELAEVPADFDWSYFQAAPVDQRVDELSGDEWIELDGMCPEHPQLRTRLPGLRPLARVFAAAPSAAPDAVPLRLDTVHIDADARRCSLLWRGSFPVASPEEAADLVISCALVADPAVATDGVGERSERTPAGTVATPGRTETVSRPAAEAADAVGSPYAIAPPQRSPESEDRREVPGAPWAQEQGRSVPVPLSPLEETIDVDAAPAARESVARGLARRPPPPEPAPVPAPAPAPPPAQGLPAVRPPDPLAAQAQARAAPVVAAAAVAPPVLSASAANRGWKASPEAAAPAPALPPRRWESVREVVELLWHDPEAASRMRQREDWKDFLAQREADPVAERARKDLPPEQRQQDKAREEVTALLRLDGAIEVRDVERAVREAMSGGTFVPPLVLVAGRLDLPFDELERLKATVSAVTPFAEGDEELHKALAGANAFLQTPVQGASSVAEAMSRRIAEIFGRTERSILPPGYLEEHTGRILLEQRCYQRRELFGAEHIRGIVVAAGSSRRLPAYLPKAAEAALPLYAQLEVRLIAEARPRLDQYEPQEHALRVMALARVLGRAR